MLGIARAGAVENLDVGLDVAVGEKQIGVSVVVDVDEIGPKGEGLIGRPAQSARRGAVFKSASPGIVQQPTGLPLKIAHPEVEATVAIVVGPIGAHSRLWDPVGTGRDAGRDSDFGKSGAVVAEQEIRLVVIGDVEIEVAVVVVVGKSHAELAAFFGPETH